MSGGGLFVPGSRNHGVLRESSVTESSRQAPVITCAVAPHSKGHKACPPVPRSRPMTLAAVASCTKLPLLALIIVHKHRKYIRKIVVNDHNVATSLGVNHHGQRDSGNHSAGERISCQDPLLRVRQRMDVGLGRHGVGLHREVLEPYPSTVPSIVEHFCLPSQREDRRFVSDFPVSGQRLRKVNAPTIPCFLAINDDVLLS